MGIFLKLIGLLRVALPLPDFTSAAAVLAWWNGLGPAASDLIADIMGQLKTTGVCEFELPGGQVVTLEEAANGQIVMSQSHQDVLHKECCAAVAPEKIGDGTILKFLGQLLPIILQFLPLLLKADPKPAPAPQPPVV